MDKLFTQHIKELSYRAYSENRYIYTHFLDLEEQTQIQNIKNQLYSFTLYGGNDASERKIAVFGKEEDMGYAPAFPFTLIKVFPLNQKFADTLTHRDFLGAVMNLNIERYNIGDIVVHDNSAYIFVLKQIADILLNELTTVKHTAVQCEEVQKLPDCALYQTQEKTLIVSSLRLDCIICAVFHLSRSQCNSLFEAQKVFVNGKLTLSNSFIPDQGDIISLRSVGRFQISTVTGNTKKGKIILNIALYV